MLTDAQLVEALKNAVEHHRDDEAFSLLLKMAAERVETLSRLLDES